MEHLVCFVMVLIFFHLHIPSLAEAKLTEGFSIDLIHRDSPLSPFYNHSTTPGQLSRNDAIRSIARANQIHPSSVHKTNIESSVIQTSSGYLMKLSIGSPPVETLAMFDTGSDLVWIQCKPFGGDNCCYHQDPRLFDPMQSSTYTKLPCESDICQRDFDHYLHTGCEVTSNECEYSTGYGDGSHTNGVLAYDTFSFDSGNGKVVSFPNLVFGCSHNTSGQFDSQSSGIIGFGHGPLSLVSQLAAQKFSYCLSPRSMNSASELKFGADAALSGSYGVVSTPFVPKDDIDTFYYLTLEGVSVGDKKIENLQGQEGNMAIDSGTELTMLQASFYYDVEAAVKEAIGLSPVQDPEGSYLLCYDQNDLRMVPEIKMVFHFTGANVTLKRWNMFTELDEMSCLAMWPTENTPIFGSNAQINFQVEYDLARKQISFAPADCTSTTVYTSLGFSFHSSFPMYTSITVYLFLFLYI